MSSLNHYDRLTDGFLPPILPPLNNVTEQTRLPKAQLRKCPSPCSRTFRSSHQTPSELPLLHSNPASADINLSFPQVLSHMHQVRLNQITRRSMGVSCFCISAHPLRSKALFSSARHSPAWTPRFRSNPTNTHLEAGRDRAPLL